MKHILFRPIYQERVWGGRSLSQKLNRTLPDDQVIGESWEIVDRPEAQSTTDAGQTIRELIAADPEGIMGAGWPAERPFPILVKWLDCQEKLSLQVHPPADIAPSLNGEPKTECWYIAEAEPHAILMAGLKNGVTREDFEAGLANNNLEPLVHTMPKTINRAHHESFKGRRFDSLGVKVNAGVPVVIECPASFCGNAPEADAVV